MLLVTLTLLSLITTNIQGCGENNFADSCWDDPSIATITYDSTTDKLKCENYDQDACSAVEASLVGTDLTSKLCEELCDVSHADATADETLKCEFFRWEKDNLHCTLMNSVQCDGGFKTCNRGQCVSGQTGCSGGDSPLPKGATCASGVAFVADSVHWICIHPTDPSIHINIYEKDGEVPAGTSCETAHNCKTFDNTGSGTNSLRVICAATSSDVKIWAQYPGTPNAVTEYMDSNSLTLFDPVCDEKADPLVLDSDELHKQGVSFICEIVENLIFTKTEVKVTADNTCALLCNLHHVLTLENELSEDGVGVWNKYGAGSDEGIVVNDANAAEMVKCWDSMEF